MLNEFKMPVIPSRQHLFVARETASARNSIGSHYSFIDHLWVVDEGHEKPPDDMDSRPVKIPSRQKRPSTLKISTYRKADLSDRYGSSEEEPSRSSLEKMSSHEDETESKPGEPFGDDDALDVEQSEFKPELAIAIPILVLGPPKLIHIADLAPMHKRKRSFAKSPILPAGKKLATRASLSVGEKRRSFSVDANIEPSVTFGKQALKRKESFPKTAPLSWFPDLAPPRVGAGSPGLHDLYMNPKPRQADRGSRSPGSSRLVKLRKDPGRQSTEIPPTTFSPPSPSPPKSPQTPKSPSTPSWRGLTRSISLMRRQSMQFPLPLKQPILQPTDQATYHHDRQHHSAKPLIPKAKMIPRGANEREEAPIIPPFPFERHLVMA
jgi:hypothetical protein